MYQGLFIGNKIVKLKEVDSTNSFMQQLLSNNEKEIEGLVVVADNQTSGRGQRGNEWHSLEGENLTFSILLKPNLLIEHQFLLSKVISLGILDFLKDIGVFNVKIKWPNDIYCGNNKIAGILIENSIRNNKVVNSVIGIGLNVNQVNFEEDIKHPTSIINEIDKSFLLEEALNQLLFFIEKRYLALKSSKIEQIDFDYLNNLYWMNEQRNFIIKNSIEKGEIVGVALIGKIQIKINDEIKEFDLKEIEFLKE